MHRRRPTYCGPAFAATLAVVAGLATAVVAAGPAQRERVPRGTRAPSPIALLPAEIGWTVDLLSPPTGPAAFDERLIYVPVADGQLVAIDWRSGEMRWTATAATTTSPAVIGRTVFVAETERVTALDADTGEPRWRVPGAFSGIWAADDVLVAVASAGAGGAATLVTALGIDDGQALWTQTVASDGPLAGLAVDAASVYLTFQPGRVVALTRRSGVEAWSRLLPGTLSAPALARDRVFVGSTDNNFYALDAADGSRRWRVRMGGDVVGAVSDGSLVFVVALDNVLRALNRTNGHQRWKQSLPTRPIAAPLVAGGAVLVPGIAPPLAAFNGTTGAPAGEYAPPGDVALQGQPLLRRSLEPFRVAVALLREGRVIGLRPNELMFREAPPAPLGALPGRALTRDVLAPPAATAPSHRVDSSSRPTVP